MIENRPIVRLFSIDLDDGTQGLPVWIALFVLLATGMAFMVYHWCRINWPLPIAHPAFGDYLAGLFAGNVEYSAETRLSFRPSAGWLLLTLSMLTLSLPYPHRSCKGIGIQTLTRAADPWGWWAAKCLWVVVVTTIPWLGIIAICAAASAVSGGSLTQQTSPDLAYALAACPPTALEHASGILSTMACAYATTIALALGQLAISLAIHPLVALSSCASLLIASSFRLSPLLPGNYLMWSRSMCMRADGVDPAVGLATALGIAGCSFFLGGAVVARKDLMGSEADR